MYVRECVKFKLYYDVNHVKGKLNYFSHRIRIYGTDKVLDKPKIEADETTRKKNENENLRKKGQFRRYIFILQYNKNFLLTHHVDFEVE